LTQEISRKIFKLYGISQNPNTNDFILVLNYNKNLVKWISKNNKIDDFIQEIQLENKYSDNVFEWILYNQFDEIKETGKNGSITIYSAIWKDGPLYYNSKYSRKSNKIVTLKCLHNSQNTVEFVINKVKYNTILLTYFNLIFIFIYLIIYISG
jgi:hypothetical protein